MAAGDIVKVHKTHSQTGLAANINWSNGTTTSPVLIICVDKNNSDALATGASVGWGTTGFGPQGNIYSYGVNYNSTAATLTPSIANDGRAQYENCTLSCTGSGGISGLTITPAGRGSIIWRNVNVDFSGASASSVRMSGTPSIWVGGTYTCRATQTDLFNGCWPGYVAGVNFSGTVTNLFGGSSAGLGSLRPRFVGCIAPTYTTVASLNTGPEIDLSGLHPSGTITVANLSPALFNTFQGTVGASLARYRTGGADDGSQANAYSWEIISNASANQLVSGLYSPPITRWVAAGASQTITVYVASGGSLNNDEFWIEVLSPSEAVSATAQSAYQSTRCLPLATPAALTTDGTSTWNGTGVGTKQKITVTINPTVAGRVTVRCYLAKASTTVYVDPVLDLTGDVNGKSRFFEGAQTFAAASGGTAGMLYHTGGG